MFPRIRLRLARRNGLAPAPILPPQPGRARPHVTPWASLAGSGESTTALRWTGRMADHCPVCGAELDESWCPACDQGITAAQLAGAE